MPTFEIYTTGGGYYLYDVFNFLAAYTGSGNYNNLLYIGVVVGVAMIAWRLAFGEGVMEAVKYVVLVAIVGGLFVGPKARVVIFDKTQGTIPIYGIVDYVPYAVALLGHYTSGVSYYVTGQLETMLSTPDNLSFQKNGMMFGASLLAQTARWRAVSTSMNENLVNFMENCVIDATNIGLTDLEMVARSGDLVTSIDANLPNSLAYYDVMAGATQACKDGWPTIKADVTNEVDEILRVKAAGMYQNTADGGAANINRLKGTLEDFQNMMNMSSASAVQTIQQAMLIQALDDASLRFISNSGNAAAMELYQAARAEVQTRASYSAIGANAAKWVPFLKIVFEAIYYSVFPLAVFMMMTPLGYSVLKGYAGGFVWIAAWEPLSAVLHSIVLKASSGFYREAGVKTTDGSLTDVVLSWSNHYGIIAVEQDVGTVAGFLMMSVPFLAYSIFFGANRMMGMATSMLNVGQGAAIDTGREAATGSMSLGNTSMNNFQSNKMNTSSMIDVGRSTGNLSDGAMATFNPDGSMSISQGSSQSNTGMSANFSQGIRSEVSSRAEHARSAVSSQSSELANYWSQGANQYADLAQTASQSNTASSDQGVTWIQEDRRTYSEAWDKVENFAETHGLSTNVAMTAMMAGSAGLSGKAIGASLRAEGQLKGVSSEAFENAVRASQSEGMNDTLSALTSSSESARTGQSNSTGENASEGQRFSIDQGRRMASTLSSTMTDANNYSQAESRLETQGVTANAALTQLIVSSLQDEGKSAAEISSILNAKDVGSLQSQQGVLNEVIGDVVDSYSMPKQVNDPTDGYVQNDHFNPPAVGELPLTTSGLSDKAGVVSMSTSREFNATSSGTIEDLNSSRAAARENQDEQTEGVKDGMDKTIGTAMTERAFTPREESMTIISEGTSERLQERYPEAYEGTQTPVEYFNDNPHKFEAVTYRDWTGDMAVEGSPKAEAYLASQASESASNPSDGSNTRTSGANNQYSAGDNPITVATEGKVRDLPVSDEYMGKLQGVLEPLGSGIGAVITSGGQHALGTSTDRTGSTRHDVDHTGHANTSDLVLTRNGQQVTPEQDPELYAQFLYHAAGEFSGVGHYGWGVHVGSGAEASWGPDTTSATLDPYFKSAIDRGRDRG